MRDFLGGSSGGRRFGGAVMNVKLTEIKNNGTPWLKIPADGSQIKFTGNADEAAKEFFNALIRVRDGYISALKAERDAQQKRADALAVENAALSAALSLISGSYGLSPHIQSMCAVDTPTTDAALAAIEAQGVEKALAVVSACRENICPGGLSENRQYEESIVQPHLDGIADELGNLIIELREDK